MSVINISAAITPNLPPKRWARNGQYPSAWFAQQLAARVNHLIYTKGKQVFARASGLLNIPTGAVAGQTDRWRFAFHTSKRISCLYAHIVVAPPGASNDSYTRVRIFDNTGLSTLGDAVLHIPGSTTANFTPAYFKSAIVPVIDGATGLPTVITGDVDCLGVVSDFDSAHVSAVTVWEVPLTADTVNGYLDPNVGVQSPVTAAFRQNIAAAVSNQWKVGSRQLLSWSVEKDSTPRTRASSTAINLIDNTTTGAPTSSTPGFVFDLTNCARAKDVASGAACKMRVYAKDSVASNGTVQLVNSAGTVVASATSFGTSAAWSSPVSFFLPAGLDKYDLQFKTSSGTLSVYAVSIYLHE